MLEQMEILARHWRQAKRGLTPYLRCEGRFDGQRFEGLAKLVA